LTNARVSFINAAPPHPALVPTVSIHAHSSTVIDAPISHVWSVMTNFAGYGDWNPFVPRFEFARPGAEPAPGQVVFYYSRWIDAPNGALRQNRGVITRFDPPPAEVSAAAPREAQLAYRFSTWLATARLVLATRQQSLRELPDGRTEYVTHEEFRGLLFMLIPLGRVQAGFDANAAALKKYCEETAPTP
jgi:hypothetical protein